MTPASSLSAPRVRRVDAGDVGSLAEGAARAIVIDGRPIAVWRIDGILRAYAGTCLHRGGPLAQGFVRDGIVTCPLHWWRYDLRTGSLVGVDGVRLPSYRVVEVEGRIVVEVPEPAAAPEAEGSIRERLLRRARAAADAATSGAEAVPNRDRPGVDPAPSGDTIPSSTEEVRS